MAFTLCMMPLLSVLGFAGLAAFPGIGVFIAFQVIRSVSNYALTRPAREVLFTAVSREDRYKTKNFIDTVVYRAGDQVAAWSYAGLLVTRFRFDGDRRGSYTLISYLVFSRVMVRGNGEKNAAD